MAAGLCVANDEIAGLGQIAELADADACTADQKAVSLKRGVSLNFSVQPLKTCISSLLLRRWRLGPLELPGKCNPL